MTYIKARKQGKTSFQEIIDINSESLPKEMNQQGKGKEILSLLRTISSHINLPIGAIDLLAIYYSTTQPQDWKAGNSCKSWVQISTASEWRGINRSTIYRHNQALLKLGIITYADYGNFRRFGFRNQEEGTIIDESTFGVNLKPVILKLQEFQSLALKIDMAKKERLHLHYRICSLKHKILNAWPDELVIDDELEKFLNTPTRKDWKLERLQSIANPLEEYWDMVVEWWQKHEENTQNEAENSPDFLSDENQDVVSENALQCDAKCTTHIYKTNIKYFVNVKEGEENKEIVETQSGLDTAVRGDTPHTSYIPPVSRQRGNSQKLEQTQLSLPFSLADMLDVINIHCQGSSFQMMNKMPHNISSLAQCAESNCRNLGIHKSAWLDAQRIMGVGYASAAVMTIQAKGKEILNPGGYLRGMTQAKKENRLHITKTMQDLIHKAHHQAELRLS